MDRENKPSNIEQMKDMNKLVTEEEESVATEKVSNSLSNRFKKINKKAIWITGTAISFAAAALIAFSVLNHPLRRFDSALKRQDSEQVVSIYNDSIKGHLDYESKIEEEALAFITLIKEEYLNHKMSYQESKSALYPYEKIEVVKTEATDTIDLINNIESSRNFYIAATESMEEGDTLQAIKYFLDVLPEDEENYQSAQSQIETLKPVYIETVLSEVETFVKSKEYDSAISQLQKSLDLFPKDQKLSTKEAEIEALLSEQKEEEEKKKIETLKSEQKLTVTNAYSEDDYIYNDGYVIVKNNTNEVVKNYTVGILMFDDYGYPVNNTYKNLYGDGNLLKGDADTPNIQPGASFGSNYYWYIEGEATQIKACVIKAEFYDGTTWINPYFEYWYEAERDRY